MLPPVVKLFFQEGSSDQVYDARIVPAGDHVYDVEVQWGRRGSTLSQGKKCKFVSSADVGLVENAGNAYRMQVFDVGRATARASTANDQGAAIVTWNFTLPPQGEPSFFHVPSALP